MVHLGVVGHDIIYVAGIHDGRNPGQEFLPEGCADRIHQGDFIGHNQIGVVGAPVLGGIPVKIADIPVNRPHPVNVVADPNRFADIRHLRFSLLNTLCAWGAHPSIGILFGSAGVPRPDAGEFKQYYHGFTVFLS
jgi:hypothetical protein